MWPRPAAWAASRVRDVIANDDFWKVKSDVLIPAALEGQITAARADNASQTRIVLEGANGPTTPDGDAVLADRGIIVVPDVIANSGGVTVSYFEWVQDFSSFFWTEDEINVRLDKIITGAFKHIWETSEQHRVIAAHGRLCGGLHAGAAGARGARSLSLTTPKALRASPSRGRAQWTGKAGSTGST